MRFFACYNEVAGYPSTTAFDLLNEGRPRGGAYLQNDVPEVFDPTGGPPSEWERAWMSIDSACTRVAAFVQRLMA